MSGSDGQVSAGSLLCIGLGYSATALARRLSPQGFRITGTSRGPDRLAEITRAGWTAIEYSGGAPTAEFERCLGEATHVLISAPPTSADGDAVLPHVADALVRSGNLAWIAYLSTVGVYGDHGGGWVDETTAPNPRAQRSQWRAEAEKQWQTFGIASGKRVEIFRLPGIYGPGRSAIDQLLAGTARRIAKDGQVFNRIHVEDVAAALAAAMSSTRYDVYNLTDNEPAPAEEIVRYAAELIGVEPPPLVAFDDAGLSPMAASFFGELKRVSNRRMHEALGVELAYPTYREGLQAIARELGLLKSE